MVSGSPVWSPGGTNSPLLQRVAGIRKQLVTSLGYLLPPVRVTDNLSLRSREYVILLKGTELSRYELLPGNELAIPTVKADKTFQGQQTREPAFGLPALWIPTDRVDAARGAGYTVVDAVNILGTHFSETIRRYAHELFSRQDAKAFCDRVTQDNPKVVEDLVPKLLSLAVVQRVFRTCCASGSRFATAFRFSKRSERRRRPARIRCCLPSMCGSPFEGRS